MRYALYVTCQYSRLCTMSKNRRKGIYADMPDSFFALHQSVVVGPFFESESKPFRVDLVTALFALPQLPTTAYTSLTVNQK